MAQVVLITGASRGIGAATARLAGRRGYAVCVNYRRDRAAAERVVADIEALAPGRLPWRLMWRLKMTSCVCSRHATGSSGA